MITEKEAVDDPLLTQKNTQSLWTYAIAQTRKFFEQFLSSSNEPELNTKVNNMRVRFVYFKSIR